MTFECCYIETHAYCKPLLVQKVAMTNLIESGACAKIVTDLIKHCNKVFGKKKKSFEMRKIVNHIASHCVCAQTNIH